MLQAIRCHSMSIVICVLFQFGLQLDFASIEEFLTELLAGFMAACCLADRAAAAGYLTG